MLKSLLLSAAVCASASLASAQTAEQLELATEYATMPAVQQMIDDMFSPEGMGTQFSAGLPPSVTLTETQIAQVGTLLSGAMTEFRPRMEDLMIASSAKYFSADELRALIDFYSSEHGAAVMSKMQPYFQEVMGAMTPELQARMQGLMPQLMQIIEGN